MTRTLSLPTLNWVRFATEDEGVPVGTQPLARLCAAARDGGFGAIGVDAFTLARPDSPPDRVGELLAEYGLACTDVGVLAVGTVDCRDSAARLAAVAGAAGARRCLTVLNAPATRAVIRDLKDCAEILAEAGVSLALEFLHYGQVTSLAQAADLCAEVGWDQCGILLDTWHFFTTGTPWDELSALEGRHVALVHANDAVVPARADLQYESRFRRLPPGRGDFDLPQFFAALDGIGYDGVVSAEVLSAELLTRDPTEVASLVWASLDGYEVAS
ncbi:sugar phosphate isomerase/epimerase [Citricoccus nitrophenolicus]